MTTACGGAARSPAEIGTRQPSGLSNAEIEALYHARRDSARMRFTDADVHFVTGMIGHHAQALLMSGLAPGNGASSSIQTLAARIINAQRDEIALMQKWLRDRGQPVPEVEIDGTDLMVHGAEHAMHMPGMLTPEQMSELEQARGPEFDRLFLTYMIQHHRGAVTMVGELVNTAGAGQTRRSSSSRRTSTWIRSPRSTGWNACSPRYPLRATVDHLETFLARAAEADPLGDGVLFWVENDFRAYLRCGILAHGFARARRDGWGAERLIAFSCKGRGVCPSCNTRRMVEVASHLNDDGLPPLPIRQWVLSLPKAPLPRALLHNIVTPRQLCAAIRASNMITRRPRRWRRNPASPFVSKGRCPRERGGIERFTNGGRSCASPLAVCWPSFCCSRSRDVRSPPPTCPRPRPRSASRRLRRSVPKPLPSDGKATRCGSRLTMGPQFGWCVTSRTPPE